MAKWIRLWTSRGAWLVDGRGARRRQGDHGGPSSSEAARQKSSVIPCRGASGLHENQEKELLKLGLPTEICRSWEQGLYQAGEQGLTGEQQSKGRLKSWG